MDMCVISLWECLRTIPVDDIQQLRHVEQEQ